jgi:hypothetical protein
MVEHQDYRAVLLRDEFSIHMATISECRYRWLRLHDLDLPRGPTRSRFGRLQSNPSLWSACGTIRNDTGRFLVLAHEKANEINNSGTSSGPTKDADLTQEFWLRKTSLQCVR